MVPLQKVGKSQSPAHNSKPKKDINKQATNRLNDNQKSEILQAPKLKNN